MLKLVYGCLAFSLIAIVGIFVLAAGQGNGFRGMTKSMGDAITQGAAVLDADRNGAVTQTGNGHITGYRRDMTEDWSTTFDPFEEGPSNPYGAGTIKSFAWCTQGCPNAILDIDRNFTSHGSAGAGLASSLTSLNLTRPSVLSIYETNAAFAASSPTDESQPLLLHVAHKDRSELPITNPLTVAVDRESSSRAIVGSANGRTGYLTRLTKGEEWEIAATRIRETDLRNICLSEDGSAIGLISTRVRRAEFLATSPGPAIGPKLTGGICTVDAAGITAVYNRADEPGTLEVARYSDDGKRLWQRALGAQKLLSKSGWRSVVAQGPSGDVTAIDAVSGRTVFSQRVTGVPFAAQDGSIVTAARDGKPRWLLVGEPPAAQ